MSPFQAERDMRFDCYFSRDILRALIELDETDLHQALRPEDEHAYLLHREGFEMAIKSLAEMFGFSYSSLASLQQPFSRGFTASPE
jgi:hypothetical protein